MSRGYVRVFRTSAFFGCGRQQAARPLIGLCLDFSWLLIPCFGSVHGGSHPLIRLHTHPGAFCLCSQAAWCLSGCPPTRGFRCGPQASDWGMHPLAHFGSGAQAAGLLIRARTHPGFQVWAPRRPSARLQVSVRAAFPRSQSRAEGGGAPETVAVRRVL